jgi:RND family efflux transporter MFP subunit
MKNIYILLASTLFLASCGEEKETSSVEDVIATNDITVIVAKKKEIEVNEKSISIQLESLNDAIAKLDTNKKLPLVTTVIVKNEEFKHFLEIQGNVSTKQNILIYPETAGVLEKILVKEGQTVKKGELLAVINDGGMNRQLAQLEAQEKLSKTIFEKQKRLWDQKIGSEIDFLTAETNYLALSNNVEQVKTQIDKTKITAPFSGTIDDILKDQGTVVSPGPGAELFRIVNLNNMYIEAEVPESYISKIKKGGFVEVYFPILNETVETKIRHKGNHINPNNRSFKIEIGVPNKNGSIKPNLTSKLKINDYTNPSAILIPQSIISENANGEQFIYTVSNKNNNEATVNRTYIKTGKTQGDVIEVLGSLKENTEIIIEGARSVNNGQLVKIIKK